MSSLLPSRKGVLFFSVPCCLQCNVMHAYNGRWLVLVWFLYRYGSIFKTHILGCPCVMISSPEAAKFVLVTKSHLFKPTFPASKERMLGKQAIFFSQGQYHAKLRKLVLRAFVPEAIKSFVSNIESIAKDSLQSLEGRLITAFQEMKTVSLKNREGKKQGCFLCFCLPCVWWYVDLKCIFYICSTHSMLRCYRYLERMKWSTEKILRGVITF